MPPTIMMVDCQSAGFLHEQAWVSGIVPCAILNLKARHYAKRNQDHQPRSNARLTVLGSSEPGASPGDAGQPKFASANFQFTRLLRKVSTNLGRRLR
jgi:hypothetical protein